jgi:hypothetical protein
MWCGDIDWIQLPVDRVQWWADVNIQVPYRKGKAAPVTGRGGP